MWSLFLTTAILLAADPVAPTSALPCEIVSIHDADSLVARIKVHILRIESEPLTLRLANADAWEIDRTRQTVTVTDAEIVKGKAARADLVALLATADLYAEAGTTDPYGRTSAILWAKPKDGKAWILIAAWLEQRGHLRTPRTK